MNHGLEKGEETVRVWALTVSSKVHYLESLKSDSVRRIARQSPRGFILVRDCSPRLPMSRRRQVRLRSSGPQRAWPHQSWWATPSRPQASDCPSHHCVRRLVDFWTCLYPAFFMAKSHLCETTFCHYFRLGRLTIALLRGRKDLRFLCGKQTGYFFFSPPLLARREAEREVAELPMVRPLPRIEYGASS